MQNIDFDELKGGAWFETSNGWFIRALDRLNETLYAIAYEPAFDTWIFHPVSIDSETFAVYRYGKNVGAVERQLQAGDEPEFESALEQMVIGFHNGEEHPLCAHFNCRYVPAKNRQDDQCFIHGVYAEFLGRTKPKMLVERFGFNDKPEDVLTLHNLDGSFGNLKSERDIVEYEHAYITDIECDVRVGDLKEFTKVPKPERNEPQALSLPEAMKRGYWLSTNHKNKMVRILTERDGEYFGVIVTIEPTGKQRNSTRRIIERAKFTEAGELIMSDAVCGGGSFVIIKDILKNSEIPTFRQFFEDQRYVARKLYIDGVNPKIDLERDINGCFGGLYPVSTVDSLCIAFIMKNTDFEIDWRTEFHISDELAALESKRSYDPLPNRYGDVICIKMD